MDKNSRDFFSRALSSDKLNKKSTSKNKSSNDQSNIDKLLEKIGKKKTVSKKEETKKTENKKSDKKTDTGLNSLLSKVSAKERKQQSEERKERERQNRKQIVNYQNVMANLGTFKRRNYSEDANSKFIEAIVKAQTKGEEEVIQEPQIHAHIETKKDKKSKVNKVFKFTPRVIETKVTTVNIKSTKDDEDEVILKRTGTDYIVKPTKDNFGGENNKVLFNYKQAKDDTQKGYEESFVAKKSKSKEEIVNEALEISAKKEEIADNKPQKEQPKVEEIKVVQEPQEEEENYPEILIEDIIIEDIEESVQEEANEEPKAEDNKTIKVEKETKAEVIKETKAEEKKEEIKPQLEDVNKETAEKVEVKEEQKKKETSEKVEEVEEDPLEKAQRKLAEKFKEPEPEPEVEEVKEEPKEEKKELSQEDKDFLKDIYQEAQVVEAKKVEPEEEKEEKQKKGLFGLFRKKDKEEKIEEKAETEKKEIKEVEAEEKETKAVKETTEEQDKDAENFVEDFVKTKVSEEDIKTLEGIEYQKINKKEEIRKLTLDTIEEVVDIKQSKFNVKEAKYTKEEIKEMEQQAKAEAKARKEQERLDKLRLENETNEQITETNSEGEDKQVIQVSKPKLPKIKIIDFDKTAREIRKESREMKKEKKERENTLIIEEIDDLGNVTSTKKYDYFYLSRDHMEDVEKEQSRVDEVKVERELGDLNLNEGIQSGIVVDRDVNNDTISTIKGIENIPVVEEKIEDKPCKVLYVASEGLPFIASGGLADVAGQLPKAIVEKNESVEMRVVFPLYKAVKKKWLDKFEFLGSFTVNLAWRKEYCGIFRYYADGVVYYFMDNERYFGRDEIYGYYDDGERFAFFSKAVVECLPYINYFPNVIHCNDWQTALVSTYIKTEKWNDDRYNRIKNIYTIHNIAYQGVYGMETLSDLFGIDYRYRNDLDYNGDINLSKAAIHFSDIFTTVSESYCDNLKQPYCSRGLHHIIIRNEHKLRGIINGIDYDYYNPMKDKIIAKNFDIDSIELKSENKRALQDELGLPIDKDTPMLAIVSRLANLKGLDLVIRIMEEIIKANDIQLVVVGTGEDKYKNYFKYLENEYPTKVRALVDKYSNEMGRKAYAASDIFLYPSKIEPCGISQMISSRYGSVPIVRETGGLKDTIKDFGCAGGGNGYTFADYNAHDLMYQIKRAIKDYRNKEKWKKQIKTVMGVDFTWNKSAKKYIDLYKSLM